MRRKKKRTKKKKEEEERGKDQNRQTKQCDDKNGPGWGWRSRLLFCERVA
jgi:hypothetical protein